MTTFESLLLGSFILCPCALAIWFFWIVTDPKYKLRLVPPSLPDGPSFVTFPFRHRPSDNSTKECPWRFPKNHPYQVFDGPQGGVWNDKQVWTNAKKLPGYSLTEDYYSDRLYHVWSPADLKETING